MGAPKIIDALDNGGPDDLRAALITDYAPIIPDATDPLTYDPRELGVLGGNVPPAVIWQGRIWYRDDTSVVAADGLTCIILLDGGHYLTNDVKFPQTVESRIIATPPDSVGTDPAVVGLAWRIPAGATGTWAGHEDDVAMGSARGWQFHSPTVGEMHYVRAEKVYEHYSDDDLWVDGLTFTPSADSVPLSAIIGAAASLTIRVENQTTYAPPGSRKTGATPTMPLGGTAANINDNDDATTGVTSALGDLSAAAFADRIVAQLTLAAATNLISIEARGVLGSAASAASAMGLWYKSAGVWAQAGSGFTLSTSSQDIQRNGAFAAVTDVALVTEAKNWAANTNTLAGLNAFDATVTASVGDAYIMPSNGISIFAGLTGKVLISEAADAFTSYTPAIGDEVFDKALNNRVRWNGTAWESSAGVWVGFERATRATAGGGTTAGTGTYVYDPATAPTTTTSRIKDDATVLTIAAPTGALLKFTWHGDATGEASKGYTAAIFRDSETDAAVWKAAASNSDGSIRSHHEFYLTAADAGSHVYTFVFMYGATVTTDPTLNPRDFTVEQKAL